MEQQLESQFMQQFTGSASANFVFAIVGILYFCVKRLCNRDSKCKTTCHTCCLDIDVRDRTIRELPMQEV